MTEYHVYMNDGLGGPVDYGTVIATVTAPTWTSSALAFPGTYIFAVRAFDSVTGYEELNTDARVALILDASGVDITAMPNAPTNVAAIPTAGGGVAIHWSYSPLGQGGAPTQFEVWVQAAPAVDYTMPPSLTVPYSGPVGSASLAGLSDGVTYAVAVRASNATATEPNTTATAGFTADATGPAAVDSLTGAATATGG